MTDSAVVPERSIRLRHATALVVGTMVGVAIFVQPAEVARGAGSPEALLATWIVAGLVALAGALVCAELASSFRDGAGIQRYLAAAFGPRVGFLWAWAFFWTIHTAIVGAIAVVFARSVSRAVPELGVAERPLAIAAIVLLSAVNAAGLRRGLGVQAALTALKLVALLALVGAGLAWGGERWRAPEPALAGEPGAWSGALLAALFAFGGWHLVTLPTSETVAPRRTLPRALILGFAGVLALYLLLNVAYLRVLPFEAIAGSTHVAADAAAALAGDAGRRTVAAVAALSALGALAGLVLVGPRSLRALAAEGMAPRWLAALDGARPAPRRALALQAVWASTLVAFDSYRALYGRALAVEWLFFALLGVAAIRLRAQGAPRRFSAPLFPLLPAAFTAVALAVVTDRVLADPFGAGLGLALAALGLPVSYLVARETPAAVSWRGEPT